MVNISTTRGHALRIAAGITMLVLMLAGGAGATKFINDNATGGDCISFGTWNPVSKICTMITNLTQTIQIDSDGITLDGNGHKLTGGRTGNGVYISGRIWVTIKNLNVTSFSKGIYLEGSNFSTLSGNNANSNYGYNADKSGNGIYLNGSNNNTLTNNNANSNDNNGFILTSSNNNTLTNNNANSNKNTGSNTGGFHLSYSSNNTLTNNNANSNNQLGFFLLNSTDNMIKSNNAKSNFGGNGGIALMYSINNTLSRNNFSNNQNGIVLGSSSNNTINDNIASSNNANGIYLWSSSNNILHRNNFSNEHWGIALSVSNNNTVSDNYVSNNDLGIMSQSINIIYHNNIITNTIQAVDYSCGFWDNGFPSGGNYWSDYTGTDSNNDGIGDTSYLLNLYYDCRTVDRYPLMAPYTGEPPTPTPERTVIVSMTPITSHAISENGQHEATVYNRVSVKYSDGEPISGAHVRIIDSNGNDEHLLFTTNSVGTVVASFKLPSPTDSVGHLNAIAIATVNGVNYESSVETRIYEYTRLNIHESVTTQSEANTYSDDIFWYYVNPETNPSTPCEGGICDIVSYIDLLFILYSQGSSYVPIVGDHQFIQVYKFSAPSMTDVYLRNEYVDRNGEHLTNYHSSQWTENIANVQDSIDMGDGDLARNAIVINFASPITVLVTSPSGKHAGFDPVSNNFIYEFNMIISNTGDEPYIVFIPNPEQGTYTFQVTGTGDGTYTMTTNSINSLGDGSTPIIITGIATTGVTDTYTITNDNSGETPPIVTLLYKFTGFFQPIDNLPLWNSVKAGSAVPVKFNLSGNQGLDIFATGYPASQKIICDSTATLDGINETSTAGSSSLSYNATIDQYNYVWKTEKAWAGTCRQLQVKLKDGTYHNASFKLLK